VGCSDDPGTDLFPTGNPDARDAQSDSQSTGTGGAGGAAPDSGTDAGVDSGGFAGSTPDAGADAPIDTHIAPDSGSDATSDTTSPDVAPDATPDGAADAADARVDSDATSPDATPDTRAPDARDAAPTSDASDAADGALPPSCDYAIEVSFPAVLCGQTTSSPNGTYQFSQIRFRQPFTNPIPIEPFTSGTMTVRNGANVATYVGASWQSPTGEELAVTGPGGAAIVFTTGVQEISVTTRDASGKVGCLPQPCTWTVTQ
jgi:hypothetical protein